MGEGGVGGQVVRRAEESALRKGMSVRRTREIGAEGVMVLLGAERVMVLFLGASTPCWM
jgi:hypothetical protein